MGFQVVVQRYWIGFTMDESALNVDFSTPELYVLKRPRVTVFAVLIDSDDPVAAWRLLRSSFPTAVQRFIVTRSPLWSVPSSWQRVETSMVEPVERAA